MKTETQMASRLPFVFGVLATLFAPLLWNEGARAQKPDTPPVLPETIENVVHSEKLGLATGLLGSFSNAGTLVVDTESIKYSDKAKTVIVPTAQMRSVTKQRLGPQATQQWVVVEYVDGADTKIAAFQPSAFRGTFDFDGLEHTLQYVFNNRKK